MCQAVRQQGATLNDLLPPTDMLHLLMMHPLRVQVSTFLYFLVYSFNVVMMCMYSILNGTKIIFENIYKESYFLQTLLFRMSLSTFSRISLWQYVYMIYMDIGWLFSNSYFV